MPLNPIERKIALLRLGVKHYQIADALGVDQPLVTNVIKGKRLNGTVAGAVMGYIAARLGMPLSDVFPDLKRYRKAA